MSRLDTDAEFITVKKRRTYIQFYMTTCIKAVALPEVAIFADTHCCGG